MTTDAASRYGTPLATYRLQLHAGFDFARATELVPYLHSLGVSHVYLSPFFAAAPGSTHGYDVFDHNQVNRELGGLAGLYELSEALVAHGMGLIADIVPNHIGISGANPWWRDVLRYGQDSPYAGYFDIDWEAQPHMQSGVLGYPVLGGPFGVTLENGELRLDVVGHEIVVLYYDNNFPLAPRSYPRILGIPPHELRPDLHDPAALAELIDILDTLPQADHETAEHLFGRFRGILADEPAIETYAHERVEQLNGQPGDPASFDQLEEVLLDQHYRLSDWRVSGEELNYRRFFDINSLAAIRVERDEVFDAVHRLLLQLVENGIATGVRVDHIDGLYDPAAYLRRLRERLDEAASGLNGAHVPIYVEKILEMHEELPRWPVEGTTGYDFLAHANALFVNHDAQRAFTTTYERFVGENVRFPRTAYDARLHVAGASFAGEINVLALQLHRIARRHRLHRDNTLRALRRAITGVLASFPVYRTYIGPEADPEAARSHIRRAIAEAAARDSSLSRAALDFLREVLLLEREDLDPEEQERRIHFRRRFQQVSSPVVAKGMEDTAFYRFNRLISLNEVGSEPSTFGLVSPVLHTWFQERAAFWPGSMSNSSTHDTKRSEDVRARLNVLSEIPAEWRRQATAWSRMNERHRRPVNGELFPDRNTEYYIYQCLVGALPASGPDDEFRERMRTHLIKAMREAKVISNWVEPDEAVETAVLEFLSAILHRSRARAFLRRLQAMVDRITPAAAHNALAALALKCFAPGFPDFYQGSEFPRFDLTDPDNRRPVDFEARMDALHHVHDEAVPPGDPACEETKLWFTHRSLAIRRDQRPVFESGDYRPVEVVGPQADSLFVFQRTAGQDVVVVAVPRMTYALLNGEKTITSSAWAGTSIDLPEGVRGWENLLLPLPVETGDAEYLFDPLPFAVLHGKRETS